MLHLSFRALHRLAQVCGVIWIGELAFHYQYFDKYTVDSLRRISPRVEAQIESCDVSLDRRISSVADWLMLIARVLSPCVCGQHVQLITS